MIFRLCWNYKPDESNSCERGEQCRYAHGQQELRSHKTTHELVRQGHHQESKHEHPSSAPERQRAGQSRQYQKRGGGRINFHPASA